MAPAAVRAGVLASLLVLRPALCAQPLPAEYVALRLGEVSFNTSTSNADAASWFRYGLLHLFSFGYDYATPAFRHSRENDPSFALAYAFEALTHFRPLWGFDDVNGTAAILANISGEAEAAASRQERLYVEAAREHFNRSRWNDKEARLRAAIAAFDRLAAEYPEDATAPAFAGLWRLELASTQPAAASSAETLGLAEQNLLAALAVDARHPGANHYVLHLYDVLNATVSENGLPAARLYPELAPDASHGQHMPGHIYLRLANYSAVYAADLIALEAADRVCALYGLADDESCDLWNLYHSLEYLHYAGYQCGRWKEAHGHWLRMNTTFASASAKQNAHLGWLALWWVRMEAREILEHGLFLFLTGKPFPDIACGVSPLLEPGFWTSHTESGALLAHGLCRVLRDRPGMGVGSPGRSELDALRLRLAQIPSEFGGDNAANPSPYYNHQVNLMHVEMLDAADYFVQAQEATDEASRRSLLEMAWATAADATALEEQLVAQPDSPTILFLSAHELVGILRLQSRQPADARKAFAAFGNAAALQATQLSTELGRARAKELEGCPGEAAAWYRSAAALLDPESDEEALPFWDEMQRGMKLEGGCSGKAAAGDVAASAATVPLFSFFGVVAVFVTASRAVLR